MIEAKTVLWEGDKYSPIHQGNAERVCVLTGASGRLGREFCEVAADDYSIVAVYRKNLPELPPRLGSSILFIQADLSLAADRQKVVDETLREFGKVDLLVNSAVHSVWASMLDNDRAIESAPQQFQMNVIVPLQLSVLFARSYWNHHVEENKKENRNIINISSIAGSKVYKQLGQGVYAASKAALDQLTRHMADEFSGIGVRVNALAPNSFPRILPTSRVVEFLLQLENGSAAGTVLILDRDG